MRAVARALIALLAAAAVPAAAAPAAGALPDGRAGVYGGGAVRDYLQFVSARVRADGTFTARATLVTRCTPRFGDTLTETVSVRDKRLSAEGAYAATRSFEDDIERGVPTTGGLHAEGTVAFSARVLARGRALGAVRVRTVYSDPRTGERVARCDTGRVAWVARRPPPRAGEGRAGLQPGTHRGTTGQDEPFLARVTDDGRMVRRAGLTVRVGCPSGVGLPLDVVAHRLRVRRGRFAGAGEFSRPFTYPDGTRVVERYSWLMLGRFGRRGVHGTFEMDGTVHRQSGGEEIGSCSTGAVEWRALR
jgi:hypothetical protein